MNAVEIEQAISELALRPFGAAEFPFAFLAAIGNNPDAMPAKLRHAHERNAEVLDRIYIGRRFRNDTERLEKVFELYTKMTAARTKRQVKAVPDKKTAMRVWA